MTEFGPRDLPLRWDVFVTPEVPIVDNDLPPGENQRLWPPISSTLIPGERDAVLVDAFVTGMQTRALVDWVEASGKKLTTVYATHGHGDHFFEPPQCSSDSRAPVLLRHWMSSRSCGSKHHRSGSHRFGIDIFPPRLTIIW
jgi:metallo-beta-lactamase superfamily protein